MLFSTSFLRNPTCLLIFISLVHTKNILDFQPSLITSTGATVCSFLLGNTSAVSLHLKSVSPDNTTGILPSPSCDAEVTRWVVTNESLGKAGMRVELKLNQSLRLCADNDTNSDCCTHAHTPCVLETLQLSACVNAAPQAALLIQARLHAKLLPADVESGNPSLVPNQVFQPLGSCPCDLTSRQCDAPCCCDQDCSEEDLGLFLSDCLPGPFGGSLVPPVPDYQCSVVPSTTDWFPFLCVVSPVENNPHLGLFFHGDTIASQRVPSFQTSVGSLVPLPVDVYVQGSPVVTSHDLYLTVPQGGVVGCADEAPVAFLENFGAACVRRLGSCPEGAPLKTLLEELREEVKDGRGGIVEVAVLDQLVGDTSLLVSEAADSSDERLVCENVTLALDYKFHWRENSITSITLTRSLGTIRFHGRAQLTTKYSAVFLNGDVPDRPDSGNPGYQLGRPVIGGSADAGINGSDRIQKTPISLWKSVGGATCSTAERRPLLFGINSTSGCLLSINRQNMSRCDQLRDAVSSLQETLIRATYVATTGNPDLATFRDWLNISFDSVSSSPAVTTPSSCSSIPSHQHVHVQSRVTATRDGDAQREIWALRVSSVLSMWAWPCGGGDASSCDDGDQLFPITSSVTFTEGPVNTEPPKTRFQINFTEYDCNRNDVCWPELLYPLTRAYTGEPYSQALAKGMVLVFFFITASVLGTPWKQIRQAWRTWKTL